MKVLQFIAILLTALALIPGAAHVASLLNKIDLNETDYFIAQNIYRGWNLFGIAIFGALFANIGLAVAVRGQAVPLRLVLIALMCLAGGLAIFFAFTFPTNQATSNWTQIPANWQDLRWQWEISHVANAAITFVGFCALIWSALLTRR